ncbi:DNA polymerase IV [Rhodovibrio salinarum]|uniref:DNA polymerase IV n=1 Tax=Rhodovibrio salinarum TaxID=1087 RepID=A0A934QJ65_9PROT|nr:DNA polymerase IV [Rhodovibrio salinarum]MBK1697535.1 DNA polymerase IV [Rhodovibrio salinarum]
MTGTTEGGQPTALCRDCLSLFESKPVTGRCPHCQSPRVVAHPELSTLSVAHLDCDAFYASIEKRDNPALADRPVIVGGGRRGVVAACCYVARIYGVRSAMPMFKALDRCPDATVIKPDMARYRTAGQRIREMMEATTPLVEPISIDEAFLDLSGTEKLHGGPPARTLAALVLRIEREVGVTASIGLSYNKFLAKIASDLDKPRGFAAVGEAEALDFLGDKPVGTISGVGGQLQNALARDGITLIRHLRRYEETELMARFGAMGRRLYAFAWGRDPRPVAPNEPAKSISGETTFDDDVDDPEELLRRLWPQCERVARRLKTADLAGQSITLKLKTRDFKIITRSHKLSDPTNMADRLYRTAEPMLRRECDGRQFRLIGIGAGDLTAGVFADPPDLLDPNRDRQKKVESAIDAVRKRLGDDAITKGRGFTGSRQ